MKGCFRDAPSRQAMKGCSIMSGSFSGRQPHFLFRFKNIETSYTPWRVLPLPHFGYANPDIKSERLLLISVFTNDVEKNPFGCKLGSYYDVGGMQNIKLKYLETAGNFIKAVAIDSSNNFTTLYFEKKWIVFE
jgi:hypothetical protein